MRFAPRVRFFDKPVFHLLLIAVFGLLAYSNTFNAPFVYDDWHNIVQNSFIKDLDNFFEPSKIDGLGAMAKSRSIGYLTFALNYRFNGLDVRGYHAVNIAIHILNAVLVYFLVVLTFRTPFFKREIAAPPARNDGGEGSKNPPSPPFAKGGMGGLPNSSLAALFSALLFVCHPVQTQAVTYIVQRFASFAAFFYLLSLVLYIKWRLTPPPFNSPLAKGGLRGASLYLLSLLSAVLAMKTKEMSATLPLSVAFYECFFFFAPANPPERGKGPLRKRAVSLAPFFIAVLLIPLSNIDVTKPLGEIAEGARAHTSMPRWVYLFTESRVIVTYIRLFFIPIGQNLDYDYPIYRSFFETEVFLSFFFLLSIAGLAFYLYRRSQNSYPALRVVAFGIFWFFITLSAESSFFPIADVIVEHRLYLPLAGAGFAAVMAAYTVIGGSKNGRKKAAVIVLGVLILSGLLYATHRRNAVWGSETSLWEDVIKKSPMKPGGYMELGIVYSGKGLVDEALKHYQIAAALAPNSADAHYNFGSGYLDKRLIDNAREEFETVLRINPNYGAARQKLDYINRNYPSQ